MTAQEHLDYWLRILRDTEGGAATGQRRRIAVREVRRWATQVRDEHLGERAEAVDRDADPLQPHPRKG